MKETVMKCECCKKTFFSECWEGGYIDHVVNFAGNRNAFVHRNSVMDMAREIVFDGNNFRKTWVIRDLINCFLTWDCFSEDFKQRVKQIIVSVLSKIAEAEEEVKRLEKSTSPLALAMLRGEDIDDAYEDLFDQCCEEDEQ